MPSERHHTFEHQNLKAHTMKRILLVVLFAIGPHWAWAQSTIAYTGGPAFPIPSEFAPASVDLDHDATADFTLVAGFAICTMDVPTSFCSMSLYVTSLGTNALLTQGYYASIVSVGEWVGELAPSNSVWFAGGNTTLLTWWWSPRNGTSGASGPLGELGEGYLGVRFSAADGQHYGWVHVREAVVLDWAYEMRPHVPIRAGARPVPVPLSSPHLVRPGYLRLTAATEIGKTYQVQAKARLDAFPWANLSFVIPATTTNMTVDLLVTAPAQFFRIVEAD